MKKLIKAVYSLFFVEYALFRWYNYELTPKVVYCSNKKVLLSMTHHNNITRWQLTKRGPFHRKQRLIMEWRKWVGLKKKLLCWRSFYSYQFKQQHTMTYRPPSFTGDIIASINAGKCTTEELIKRFDNHTNSVLQQRVYGKVTELVSKGQLQEDRNGVLRCTAAGLEYIAARGYLA